MSGPRPEAAAETTAEARAAGAGTTRAGTEAPESGTETS
jgi:hypothetical protein